jgi:Lon protease-like protein
MPELGLFPLGIVLLPTEQIPLHIFEPRYRELIEECLETGEEFGLVLADDDGSLAEIGTRARVTEVLERFDDGRLDVVVEGGERFRLVGLTEGRAFRTAEVAPVEDVEDPAAPDDIARVMVLFDRLLELTGAIVERPEPDAERVSFAVAARFEFAPELKQGLLSLLSERERVEMLGDVLETAAETVEREQEIAARAATNGKVTPRDGDSA